jgi:hypothetical protein
MFLPYTRRRQKSSYSAQNTVIHPPNFKTFHHNITTNLNVSLVKSEMRDKAGVDAATLAKNWATGIEAAKRTRLVTTQRGIRRMIHPSLTKRYKTNDRQTIMPLSSHNVH